MHRHRARGRPRRERRRAREAGDAASRAALDQGHHDHDRTRRHAVDAAPDAADRGGQARPVGLRHTPLLAGRGNGRVRRLRGGAGLRRVQGRPRGQEAPSAAPRRVPGGRRGWGLARDGGPDRERRSAGRDDLRPDPGRGRRPRGEHRRGPRERGDARSHRRARPAGGLRPSSERRRRRAGGRPELPDGHRAVRVRGPATQ